MNYKKKRKKKSEKTQKENEKMLKLTEFNSKIEEKIAQANIIKNEAIRKHLTAKEDLEAKTAVLKIKRDEKIQQ